MYKILFSPSSFRSFSFFSLSLFFLLFSFSFAALSLSAFFFSLLLAPTFPLLPEKLLFSVSPLQVISLDSIQVRPASILEFCESLVHSCEKAVTSFALEVSDKLTVLLKIVGSETTIMSVMSQELELLNLLSGTRIYAIRLPALKIFGTN